MESEQNGRLRRRMTPHDRLRVNQGRLQLQFKDGWRDVLRVFRSKRKGFYWLRAEENRLQNRPE